MKGKLTFDIECGENTCAVRPGEFCRFFTYKLNGRNICYLFGEVYDDDSGWVQRHPDCYKHFKRN